MVANQGHLYQPQFLECPTNTNVYYSVPPVYMSSCGPYMLPQYPCAYPYHTAAGAIANNTHNEIKTFNVVNGTPEIKSHQSTKVDSV